MKLDFLWGSHGESPSIERGNLHVEDPHGQPGIRLTPARARPAYPEPGGTRLLRTHWLGLAHISTIVLADTGDIDEWGGLSRTQYWLV